MDNGNTASARERLWAFAKNNKRVRLAQGQGNVGFGRGCNYGARMAKGDYILFLNPDALIAKGAAMMQWLIAARDLTRPWISGGMLKTVNGAEQRGARRSELTPLSAVVSFTPLHKLPGFKNIHLENTATPKSA